MFGFGKDKKKIPYKINVEDEDYTIVFNTLVNRSKLASYFTKLARVFPVKETFAQIEKDKWGLYDTVDIDKAPLAAINKKFRKNIKAVAVDVQKDHKFFRILSSQAVACEFQKVGDKYKVKITITGICV